MNGNPAEAQASSRLLYKLLKLKARTALWPSATLGSRFFRGVEDVAQIDFVELDRGLGGRLERGLDLGRLAGGGIKGFGEAKAERGERFRVGLFLVGRGRRAGARGSGPGTPRRAPISCAGPFCLGFCRGCSCH